MILAFLLVVVLCSVLSFPHYNGFSDSDIKITLTKNPKFLKDNALDLVEQDFDQAQKQIGLFKASKRQFRSNRTGIDALTPKELWSLQCAPYCQPEYRPEIINEDNSQKHNNDDILLHLRGDKDLYKFLEWTMEQLGSSLNSYNTSGTTGSYYSGMDMWKKGHGETPLYVEEPKYIVVNGDPDYLEQKLNFDGHSEDIPFIPSRGRKFNPQWQDIVYEEIFIPSRRKKNINQLKDILKYDEIFVPLRGKKRTSSSSVIDADDDDADDGVLRGKNKVRTSGGYHNYQATAASPAGENDHQTFGDCFTPRCVDITSALVAPSHQLVTNQAGNINALVSAGAIHLPSPPWQAVLVNAYNNNANIAADADGHQEADVACAVADCQKENDVKINGFDQSVRAQEIHQRQQQQRRRRLLSSLSSAAASVEAGASKFFQPQQPSSPSRSSLISQSDQLGRLQQYPIRNKQWRDYYAQEMAALSRRFPPF